MNIDQCQNPILLALVADRPKKPRHTMFPETELARAFVRASFTHHEPLEIRSHE